jgi:hypothetical protein
MSQSPTNTPSRRARRETRREEIASAARALREGIPYREEPRAPSAIARHDLAVLAALLLLLIGGVTTYNRLSAPATAIAEHGALRLAYPAGWLPGLASPPPPAPLARAAAELSGAALDHRAQTTRTVYAHAADPMTRIEIEIRPRPPYSNLPAALALARAVRYGERYDAHASGARAIAGRDWFRTGYRYAYGGTRSPRVAHAVDYAAPSGETLYVVTLHGDPTSLAALERDVTPTLTLSTERAQRGGAR